MRGDLAIQGYRDWGSEAIMRGYFAIQGYRDWGSVLLIRMDFAIQGYRDWGSEALMRGDVATQSCRDWGSVPLKRGDVARQSCRDWGSEDVAMQSCINKKFELDLRLLNIVLIYFKAVKDFISKFVTSFEYKLMIKRYERLSLLNN